MITEAETKEYTSATDTFDHLAAQTTISVNANFCQLSKYSRQELILNDHKIVNSGYHTKEYIRQLWNTISKGEIWKGDLKNKAKDGTYYWVSSTIAPLLTATGTPRRYIAITTDITEQKKAEERHALLAIRQVWVNLICYKILHVLDGEAALNFLFGTGKFSSQPDMSILPKIVLLDIKMPKVNGIEVLQTIRSDERTKNTPVVMLTSSDQDPDIRKCYSLGANSYIVKPVDFDRFSEVIKNIGFYWLLLNKQSL